MGLAKDYISLSITHSLTLSHASVRLVIEVISARLQLETITQTIPSKTSCTRGKTRTSRKVVR